MPYSQSEAYAVHQYNPDFGECVAWEFEPLGGYGAWVGPRPSISLWHGGGWGGPPFTLDVLRYPTKSLGNADAIADAFRAVGYTVFVCEYPTGFHPPSQDNACPWGVGYPRNLIAGAAWFSFAKANLAARIRPDEMVAYGNSAGSWFLAMIAGLTETSGLFPYLSKPWGVTLDALAPRASPRMRALIGVGIPWNFAQADPSRKRGSPASLPAVLEEAYRYHPRLQVVGTLAGSISVGAKLNVVGDTTKTFTVATISGSPTATAEVLVNRGEWNVIAGGETLEVTGSGANTIGPVTVTVLDHLGWLEIPLAPKMAVSPAALFVDGIHDDEELAEVRQTAWYVNCPGNPSVPPLVGADPTALVPGLHIADDAFFTPEIEDRLNALGITNRARWGTPAAGNPETNGQITAVSNPLGGSVDITIAAEGFQQTGATVEIAGVLGATEANGVHVITKLSATTFRLVGVVGTGNAYTSGGRWVYHNATGLYALTAGGLAADALDWLENTVGIVP